MKENPGRLKFSIDVEPIDVIGAVGAIVIGVGVGFASLPITEFISSIEKISDTTPMRESTRPVPSSELNYRSLLR